MILEPGTEFPSLYLKSCFPYYDFGLCRSNLKFPRLVKALRSEAPNVVLDFLTPSDVSYRDMEQGKVDLAINRFNEIPRSFHQVLVSA